MGFSQEVLDKLAEPLDSSSVSKRAGSGGGKEFSYLKGHYVKEELHRVFGPGNVSIRIEQVPTEVRPGLMQAVVSVTLSDNDGEFVCQLSDVGYGTHNIVDTVNSDGRIPLTSVQAIEKAGKEAVTDAIKRAMVVMGDRFGLVLYDGDDPIHDEAASSKPSGPPKKSAGAGPPKKQPAKATGEREPIDASLIPPPNAGDGYACEDCGEVIDDSPTASGIRGWTAGEKAYFSTRRTNRILCSSCGKKATGK